MEEHEFIVAAENIIYKEVAKGLNLLLGKQKTSSLSIGLFLKLPIVVSLEKVDREVPKLDKQLKSMMDYFTAYVKSGITHEVYFTFLYTTERDLNLILKHLERHTAFWVFVYTHECLHIIHKHNTVSYDTLMRRIAKDIHEPHQLINIAEDYNLNYKIKDLFLLSPILAPQWPEIEAIGMYKKEYHTSKMSDIDILKDLIKQGKYPTITQVNELLEKVCMDGNCSIQPKTGKATKGPGQPGDKCGTTEDDADIAISDLSNSLQDIISSATKGTEAGKLMNELFEAIETPVAWFKKIKASFKKRVYYATHEYSTSWANLNNTFRKIYKSPKKLFVESKLEVILSVDHSGSVGTEELQRLLYLIESESKSISKITVLIHDTRVVKVFTIEEDFDIANSKDFKEAFATRHIVGGTSHSDVFKHLQDMKIKDVNKVIFICFSDMYSDIESEVSKFKVMKKLPTYWLHSTNAKKLKGVGGISIYM